MKTYKVTVGDKEYIVKLKEVAEGTTVDSTVGASALPDLQPVAAATATAPAAAAPVVAEQAVASGDAEIVDAPLQGSIMAVNIAPGDQVQAGEIVLIIEAMKLENEVVAPRDGTVEQVFVKEGESVNSEDALYSLV